ncbi:MAG: hypothetical protein JW798_16225 [Prolixibacteraceae bacterium]|nr:hypothetical protein [Prolixibacteraceae bacterium]
MKKPIFTWMLIASAFIMTTTVGQEPDKKTEKAKEDLQEQKLDVVVAKQDLTDAQHADYISFREESDMKIKKNQESINDLKIKVLKNDEKFRTDNQKRISVLEQKNVNLQKEMNEYVNESPEEWEAFKTRFNQDMDDLVKALKDFTILT